MKRAVSDPFASSLQALTAREKETLRLLLRGHDAKSIAHDLGLSVHTVNERLREVRKKLGVTSSREAARLLAEMEQDWPKSSVDKEFGVGGAPPEVRGGVRADQRQSAGHRLVWLGGGMLVMSLVIAVVALSLAFHGSGGVRTERVANAASADVPNATDPDAINAARTWLTLLDSQQWEATWRTAAPLFKSQVSAARWVAMVQPIRQPLGAVSSRTVQSTTMVNSQYEVIQFQTNFANNSSAVETVNIAHDAAGWKVVGYFIR
jgi:DNA-binding CsgD family transcriptional regulator